MLNGTNDWWKSVSYIVHPEENGLRFVPVSVQLEGTEAEEQSEGPAVCQCTLTPAFQIEVSERLSNLTRTTQRVSEFEPRSV